ncbi:hypothetical protein L3Q82_006838 [Scortum barcoo]|uniref:Uncharacterized protein n=1 Tax=Scortum barcoo TaxID=214431 RepID=A0ACB8WWZ4_9TELE|nr:hypothetical protein L3Q82_006838 [Scortum barcoo]
MTTAHPVALTSTIMKCSFITSSLPDSLDPLQFAYRPNRSTEDVHHPPHTALSHLDQRDTYVRMLFIDYSSAFNTIDPSKFVTKLMDLRLNTALFQRFISEDKLPHLLFYGPPGTGKTSTILACAKQLYKDKEFNSMVLELNASDDRGIDVVRGPVLSFASTRTIFKKGFKLVILDEADAMTQDAQNALRRVIEKFTENTRFCLICNYLSKIIPALQSRCTRFRFGPLSPDQMIPRLEHVVQQERHRLASGTDEKIQLSSMVAAFQAVRDLVVSEAS